MSAEQLQKAKRDQIIHILIFPIKAMWIPEDYEEALLDVNIWPSNYTRAQCREMFKHPSFTRNNTVFHTKAPKFEYANYYGEIVEPE